MADVTLTVPAKYAEDFRAALMEELASDIGWIKEQRKSLSEALDYGDESKVRVRRADLLGSQRHLAEDVELMAQLGTQENGTALEVRSASPAALAHACETMADKVVGPALGRALDVSPLDTDRLAQLRDLMGPLAWAAERAAEFHEKASVERQRDRGEDR